MPSARRRSLPRPSTCAAGLLAGTALASLSSCGPMESIDRSVERLVAKQSGSLGPDAYPPSLRTHVESSYSVPGQNSKNPATVNPSAEELPFSSADTDPTKVLARLESYSAPPIDPQPLDLEGAFTTAQRSGREFVSAEENYILSAIALLQERHLWGPRFFDDLSLDFGANGTDSNFDTALGVINELRATQRLPYGGEVEAALITSATQNLSGVAGGQYTDATAIVLAGNVPLLRNAGIIAQESLIQAERNLVYASRDFEDFRRRYLVEIARDYFNLIALQSSIFNQERRLESVRQFQEQTRAKVDAGRAAAFEARRVEQDVLSSQNDLINAKEVYLLALDRFKVRLGMPSQTPIKIEPVTLELPEPGISVAHAAELALSYRLDYQNQRDQLDDSRRAVANARNQLLPDLDLTASARFGSDPTLRRGRLRLDAGGAQYAAGMTFSVPLDREIEQLDLRSAVIDFQRTERNLEEFRDNLILDARGAVREIDRARLSVELQRRTVEINELRLEELRIKVAEIEPRDRLDAETDLLDARNQFDVAVRDLRIAILDYLVITGQMRVNADGTFRPLQGMLIRIDTDEVEPEAVPPAALVPAGPPTNPADPGGAFDPLLPEPQAVPDQQGPDALPPARNQASPPQIPPAPPPSGQPEPS